MSRNGGLPDFRNFWTPKTPKLKITKNKPRRPETAPRAVRESPVLHPEKIKTQTRGI